MLVCDWLTELQLQQYRWRWETVMWTVCFYCSPHPPTIIMISNSKWTSWTAFPVWDSVPAQHTVLLQCSLNALLFITEQLHIKGKVFFSMSLKLVTDGELCYLCTHYIHVRNTQTLTKQCASGQAAQASWSPSNKSLSNHRNSSADVCIALNLLPHKKAAVNLWLTVHLSRCVLPLSLLWLSDNNTTTSRRPQTLQTLLTAGLISDFWEMWCCWEAACVSYFNTFLFNRYSACFTRRVARFQRANEPSGLFLCGLWSHEQLWLQEPIHKNNYRALTNVFSLFLRLSVCLLSLLCF